MLLELRIENLLVIERAELRLGTGLNVLTGETGAGKTVLAHSLDLLMGGKARRGIVRPGAAEAWVEGVFDLPDELRKEPELAAIFDRLPEDAGELVLGRRVSATGRTSAFVGGRSASAGDLHQLTQRLIAFYGQHEHRKLTIASAQLAMVDAVGGKAQATRLKKYRSAWHQHSKAVAELDEIVSRDQARERDLDLLRFELKEIEAASPSAEEQAELVTERDRLRHSEGLRLASQAATVTIDGGAPDDGSTGGGVSAGLAAVTDELSAVKGVDPELDALGERFEGVLLEIQDAAAEMRRYGESIEADPGRLAEIEERLDLFHRLERKHGGSIAKVLQHAEDCRARVEQLEGGESRELELRAEIERLELTLADAAAELTSARQRAAKELSASVSEQLEDLAMPGASLEVELKPVEGGPGPSGAQTVDFLLAPNPGMEAMPLREAASGGELSRVMLTLAGTGSGADERTLVFDEIDAGIGGHTATVVAQRLRSVAADRQVIAITHLPQVAARAQTHFTVEKRVTAEIATAAVSMLEEEGRVDEIRRMMGAASGDEAATRHARELVASKG